MKIVRLLDIAAKQKNAIVDGPFGSSLKTSDYIESGIPVLQGKNITGNKFVFSDIRYISEQKANELSRSRVFVGDYLMVKIGSIGYVARIDTLNEYPYAIIPANLAKISIDKTQVYPLYFEQVFKLPKIKRNLINQASKTAQPALSLSKIKNFQIPLPSYHDQIRIANLLTKTERLIEKRKESLRLLDELIKARFLEMFGDPALNDKKFKIEELNKLLSRPTLNGLYVQKERYVAKGVEMVHMSDLFYDIVQRGNLKRVEIDEKEVLKYEVSSNDILIARRSLNFEGAAKACLIPISEEPLVFESSMIRVTPNEKLITPLYLYYFFNNERAKEKFILKHVTKSTISGINQSNLNQIKIITPPIKLQIQFSEFVETVEVLKQKQQNSLQEFENLYNSLMQKAFKGELELKDAEWLNEVENSERLDMAAEPGEEYKTLRK